MSDISFGSTYRISITQAGVNSAKKAKLKELIESYPNGLIGKSKTGHARVSVPDSEDAKFVGKLKALGFKVFQKFEGENISKENLDTFIKEKLDSRDFSQKGKQYKRMSTEMKSQRRYERNLVPQNSKHTPEEIDTGAVNESISVPEKLDSYKQKDNMPIKNSNLKDVKLSVAKADSVDNNSNVLLEMDKIRQSAKYLELKEKYGEEFAEAVYFGRK
mgnify:CR=1 FL=1